MKKRKTKISVEAPEKNKRAWLATAAADERQLSDWVRVTLNEKAREKGFL